MHKRIAILGSTGSIGTQALEVVRVLKDKLSVQVLTAQNNAQLLIEQALEFRPAAVVIGDIGKYQEVAHALAGLETEVHAGPEALEAIVTREDIDMVLTALVGFSGLRPTVQAIRSGKPIALANKETLVVAGTLVMSLAAQYNVPILPVDSEHSALFQCLVGEKDNRIEKIYLTASGGPFRGYTKERLESVTLQQALKHPNWEMGAKITIDSASMMNKGLEVIEAHWLFGLPAEKIDVLVHPQSIVHSMVQFEDGSIKAQLGLPDMRLPIQYALLYPERHYNPFPRMDFSKISQLTFEQVDQTVFKNLALAYKALEVSGNAPCVLNAANEVSNQLFREQKISFSAIADLNEAAMEAHPWEKLPGLDSLIASDAATRDWVLSQV